MPALSGMELPSKQVSPFERLNDTFRNQNGEMEELISRCRNRLHSLSDTNVPKQDKLANKEQEKPFSEGHLMSYNNQLERQAGLIYELREQVEKLEKLI